MPVGTRSGSSISLKAASGRQAFGSPYSAYATEAKVSPAIVRWTRRTSWLPDVGFCRNCSPGISSRLTLQAARIGVPSELNKVNFALTEVTNAGKLEMVPQCSTTSGGVAFFWPALFCVATQQESNVSTALTTESSRLSVASKNISSVIFDGSGPMNSGGPAFFDPLVVLRSHLTDLLMVTSLGLNWKGTAPRLAPGAPPPAGAGDGSYSVSWAFSICPDALAAPLLAAPPPAFLAEASSAMGSVMATSSGACRVSPSLAGSHDGRARRSPWPPSGCPD